MEVLILSCGTGGGHNAAGHAVEAELKRRGHSVTFFNPYDLRSRALSELIDQAYIKMVQRHPKLFGCVYQLGNLVRKIPGKSPVYYANARMADRLEAYIQEHPVDYIVMPHLYPAEMVTYLYRHHRAMPHTLFIGTDYTCIPFTEETECERYVIPAADLKKVYQKRGVPTEKLFPIGIPVSAVCAEPMSKKDARARLGLDADKSYLLLAGGSMGTGAVQKALKKLAAHYADREDVELIVICGSNASVRRHLEGRFGDTVQLLGSTPRMAEYMSACDLYLTKPGGLSTTEAAVMETPLALMPPIPGCESRNLAFFTKTGMAVPAILKPRELEKLLTLPDDPQRLTQMHRCQHDFIPKDAPTHICALASALAQNTTP